MYKILNVRLLTLLFILLIIGCGKKEKEVVLIERDGVSYEQGAQKPYSGPASSKYSNGKIKTKGQYIDGVPSGVWKFWDRNGVEMQAQSLDMFFIKLKVAKLYKRLLINLKLKLISCMN